MKNSRLGVDESKTCSKKYSLHIENDFCNLIRKEEKYIMSFIRSRCWNEEDIEDVFQHTMLEAFKSRKSFVGDSQPRTWICAVAFNVMKKYNKRKYIDRNIVSMESSPNVLKNHESDMSHNYNTNHTERAYELDSALKTTENYINEFSDNIKDVFVAVVVEGKSYQETARDFDIPIGTVRSKIARARMLLREQQDTLWPSS